MIFMYLKELGLYVRDVWVCFIVYSFLENM
jgi:hypothetical protein